MYLLCYYFQSDKLLVGVIIIIIIITVTTITTTEDIRNLTATIVGPPNSHYAGYEFDLKIYVPAEYPIAPPVISFMTKIFHPNVLFKVLLIIICLLQLRL